MITGDTVSVGVQAGDRTAHQAVSRHVLELRTLLRQHCRGPFSREVDEFAIVLRVDGDIWHWEEEGVSRIRVNRKARTISADVGIPRGRWEVEPDVFRRFLAESIAKALEEMAGHLAKKKLDVDLGSLREAVDTTMRAFWSGWSQA